MVNMNLKQNKNSSDCNFYYFSAPLVPYLNNFLVVCLCIVIFYGLYPRPINGSKKYFRILELQARKISNFLRTFCIGGN